MVKYALSEAMIHLGKCVQQLIATITDNYEEKIPFSFSKIDIKYGFWRLAVSEIDTWKFCYIIPQFNKVKNVEYIEVVVPNFLQMGWC